MWSIWLSPVVVAQAGLITLAAAVVVDFLPMSVGLSSLFLLLAKR
jgi:hypothetical protein